MELLRTLCQTPGIPGREERVRQVVADHAREIFDDVRCDRMGNLICRMAPRVDNGSSHSVLLASHMDEIGFYVQAIDDDGYLRVHNVGGFDMRTLFARRVLVQGREDVLGVMHPSGKPLHLATEEDRKKIPDMSDILVDLFMPADRVRETVRVGDPVTLHQPFEQIGDYYTAKALDNRIGIWVSLKAAEKVRDTLSCELYFVATVQEEVGLRGAGPGIFGIDPDVAIAVDTTAASDTPGVDKVSRLVQLGKGVGLKVMDGSSIGNRQLLDELAGLGEQRHITYQIAVMPRGGNDAGPMQRTGSGRPTLAMAVPTRYIHTTCEAVHSADAGAAIDLLAAYLSK